MSIQQNYRLIKDIDYEYEERNRALKQLHKDKRILQSKIYSVACDPWSTKQEVDKYTKELIVLVEKINKIKRTEKTTTETSNNCVIC